MGESTDFETSTDTQKSISERRCQNLSATDKNYSCRE